MREFYANFPEALPVTMDLFTSSVPPPWAIFVRGVYVLFTPTVIRRVLHLPDPSPTAADQAIQFLASSPTRFQD